MDVRDRVALDVGASTGGFTDCLLQHGAKFVYAVDVGYGQLAWKLRKHPQVQSIEKTNIRHLTPTLLSEGEVTLKKSEETRRNTQTETPSSKNRLHNGKDCITIAVIDVSFISLRTVLPSVIKILTQQNSRQQRSDQPLAKDSRMEERKNGRMDTIQPSNLAIFQPRTDSHYDIIALLKPQFEAGKAHVKKGGIVSDKQVHIETIDNLRTFITEKLDATVHGLTYSPIHKDIGNIEYLLWLTVNPDPNVSGEKKDEKPEQTTAEIVADAHETFQSSSRRING